MKHSYLFEVIKQEIECFFIYDIWEPAKTICGIIYEEPVLQMFIFLGVSMVVAAYHAEPWKEKE